MVRGMARGKTLVLAAVGIFTATAAIGYENGRLPRSVLARVYCPSAQDYLRKDAAASWNTMRLFLKTKGHDLYPGGSISAYRTYAEQVQAKATYGSNAATPGTSNHGLGLAVDVATHEMRSEIDRYGAHFGWAKKWSDASWEWWHIKFRTGVWHQRPDPGIDSNNPVLRRGSGGMGQDSYVLRLQKLLRHHGLVTVPENGEFGRSTEVGLKLFQKAARVRASGVADARTWDKLRSSRVKVTVPTKTPVSVTAGGSGISATGPGISATVRPASMGVHNP